MNIYDRITDLLHIKNKSRRDLCNSTGISYNTLTSLFQRKSESMRLDTLILISEYLEVSADYLIKGTDSPLELNEKGEYIYSSKVDDSYYKELLKIAKSLDYKNRTILLSKAYELDDKLKK